MSDVFVRQLDILMEKSEADSAEAVVAQLQDRIDELKEQIATLQRDNAALAKTIFDGSGCKPDHQGPIDGYCFLGLNFTPEQYEKIAQPIINHGALGSLEFCTEEAIVSLIESAGSYDHRLFVKAKQFIEEVLGRPLNPTEETLSDGIKES